MADLPEQPLYEEGIYQIEEHDPVMAGPDGIDNLQSKQLANRTAWLKQQLSTLQQNLGDIDAYTQAEVDALIAEMLTQPQADTLYTPVNTFVGFFFPFAGDTPPNGFLECNGAAISRTAYANLFAAIGNTWGDGDGSTTFNIPDMRGEFLRGWDNGRGVDLNRTLGGWQNFTIGPLRGTKESGGTTSYTLGSAFYARIGSVQNSGLTYLIGATNDETRPRNISSMFCIKY